jgi:DNA mismatch endonuclease, patch repair protein
VNQSRRPRSGSRNARFGPHRGCVHRSHTAPPPPQPPSAPDAIARPTRPIHQPRSALRPETEDSHRAPSADTTQLPSDSRHRRTGQYLHGQLHQDIAVFLDGCFWHGCPEHHTAAVTNAAFWAAKVARNRERDRETDERLKKSGWVVVRVWEHEDPGQAALRVAEAVRGRQAARGRSSD